MEAKNSRKRWQIRPLSLARRWVGDMLHFAKQVPSVPVQKRMQLAEVVQARANAITPPRWISIFTKAFALVAAEQPILRQAFLTAPWPRLFEAGMSIAALTVEREYQGERAVFQGQIKAPDQKSLAELDRRIDHYCHTPIEKIGGFRRVLHLCRLWQPIRRLAWWIGLNLFPKRRANFFGTYLVSVYSGLGAESLHPIAPTTYLLNYGVIGADGSVDVRIIYDHRVTDGAVIARALKRMEEVLRTEIVAELRSMSAERLAA